MVVPPPGQSQIKINREFKKKKKNALDYKWHFVGGIHYYKIQG